MRLFADACVHTDLVTTLRKRGMDIEWASEVGLTRADDDAIFDRAFRTRRILLTADKDFGNIIRFNIQRSRGVVLIDMDRMSRDTMIRRAIDFFMQTSEHRLRGALWIIGIKGLKTWPK